MHMLFRNRSVFLSTGQILPSPKLYISKYKKILWNLKFLISIFVRLPQSILSTECRIFRTAVFPFPYSIKLHWLVLIESLNLYLFWINPELSGTAQTFICKENIFQWRILFLLPYSSFLGTTKVLFTISVSKHETRIGF